MLNYQVLTTKLNRPKCFQTYFKRERLEKLLDKNSNRIATFVIAGAGYGKSTLISQWIENKQSVWISCDAEMNNLEVFLSYIVFASAKEQINFYPLTTQLLSSPNAINEETLIHTFFSEANNTTKKTYVVFDDFHFIKDAKVLKLLELYLNFPPENIHVILITRHDPAFSFSKHRLNNVFFELRMKDLSLSETEIEQYAFANFNLKLTKKQIDQLLMQTEGWFLGLTQLLSAYDTLQIPIKTGITVLQHDQFNYYFAEEVIQRQPQNHHKILFVSSLFYPFNHALIEHVLTKIEPDFPVNEISGTLMNKNNFTISLDSSNTYFRFHHQFHDALNVFFQNHSYSKQRKKCLEYGGQWLIDNHFYEDGIQKILESENISLAILRLSCFRYDLLNTDQYTRLGHIVNLFPAGIKNSNIELLLIQAILLENQGKYEVLPKVLDNCSDSVQKEELSKQQLGEYRLWQALLLFYSGDYSECLRFVNEALSLMADYASSIITFAYAYKALALNNLNKTEEAMALLSNRLDLLHKNQYQSIVRTLVSKVVIYSLHSNLTSRQLYIPQIIEISDQHNYYETLGMGLYFQIETHYRTGNHGQCDTLYNKAHEIRYMMRPVWYAYILGCKIDCLFYQDKKSLEAAMNQLDEFAKEQNAENINQFQNALIIDLALRVGNYDKALHLHQQTNYHLYPPFFNYFLAQITELKVLLYASSNDNLDEFYKASENLWKFGQAQHHSNLLLKLNILTSIASYMQGNSKLAAKYMTEALNISETTGDRFVYKEFSDHVFEILTYMQKNNISSPHLQHILSLFEVSDPTQNKEAVELKDRDITLLNYVAQGLSNAQIANAMFLSPQSVKKYLYGVYKELGVKNRTHAVLKAREIGFLK